ncbi:MAG: hypothetical protein H8D23_17630 [Candidatus Brocadiales bacterium]|nr:hypothetical protein [Candidatus Brocadiales bacterium]
MSVGRICDQDVKIPMRGIELVAQMLHGIRNDITRRGCSSIYTRVVTVFGAGPEQSTSPRELHRIIDLFNSLGINLKNIIAVDSNKDFIDSWASTGITTVHGDWNDTDVLIQVKEIAHTRKLEESTRTAHITLYFDSFGDRTALPILKNMISILSPRRVFSFHATRSAGTVNDYISWFKENILERYVGGKVYEFADLGEASQSNGFLTYGGCAVVCLKGKRQY